MYLLHNEVFLFNKAGLGRFNSKIVWLFSHRFLYWRQAHYMKNKAGRAGKTDLLVIEQSAP